MSEPGRPVSVANLKAPPIYKVILTQFFTSVSAAVTALLLLDEIAAYSVLLGGLICTATNGYFARKSFRYRGARVAPLAVRAMYAGETGKLVMTVGLFALVFASVEPLYPAALIAGFIITIIAGLIATAKVVLKTAG